jgi:hypothetical protein
MKPVSLDEDMREVAAKGIILPMIVAGDRMAQAINNVRNAILANPDDSTESDRVSELAFQMSVFSSDLLRGRSYSLGGDKVAMRAGIKELIALLEGTLGRLNDDLSQIDLLAADLAAVTKKRIAISSVSKLVVGGVEVSICDGGVFVSIVRIVDDVAVIMRAIGDRLVIEQRVALKLFDEGFFPDINKGVVTVDGHAVAFSDEGGVARAPDSWRSRADRAMVIRAIKSAASAVGVNVTDPHEEVPAGDG